MYLFLSVKKCFPNSQVFQQLDIQKISSFFQNFLFHCFFNYLYLIPCVKKKSMHSRQWDFPICKSILLRDTAIEDHLYGSETNRWKIRTIQSNDFSSLNLLVLYLFKDVWEYLKHGIPMHVLKHFWGKNFIVRQISCFSGKRQCVFCRP